MSEGGETPDATMVVTEADTDTMMSNITADDDDDGILDGGATIGLVGSNTLDRHGLACKSDSIGKTQ